MCYMARSYPQVLKYFPDLARRLMLEIRMFDQLSVVSRLGAFDHFASMCFSVEAKETLEDMFKGIFQIFQKQDIKNHIVSDSKDLENTLGAAGAACTMGTMELKCRTLQAVTLLFQNSELI